MPKRNVEFFILDMLLSIDRVNRYSKKLKHVDTFIQDEAACNILLHDLALIGEAMKHILQAKKLQALIKPRWREIVSFRNFVIHEYFGLDYYEVFRIIKKEVPKFEKELLKFVKNFEDRDAFCIAMDDVRLELTNMGRKKSLKYLDKILLCSICSGD